VRQRDKIQEAPRQAGLSSEFSDRDSNLHLLSAFTLNPLIYPVNPKFLL
jgi:hypothetical protein